MTPSINDFILHWNFDYRYLLKQHIGILFGENILVYNEQVINLTKLFNDNGRIYNAVIGKKKIYVLLNNNNLYAIETTNLKNHKLICKYVKNIYSKENYVYILRQNGYVVNDKLNVIQQNTSVITNVPRCCNYYDCIHVCDNNNEFFEFCGIARTPQVGPKKLKTLEEQLGVLNQNGLGVQVLRKI